jgi:hypothetical protein
MFRYMSRHHNEFDPDRLDGHDLRLPPPSPPQLMSLTINGPEGFVGTWDNVTASSLVGPAVFRFETLDGKIRLFDMSGHNFVLTPQGDR